MTDKKKIDFNSKEAIAMFLPDTPTSHQELKEAVAQSEQKSALSESESKSAQSEFKQDQESEISKAGSFRKRPKQQDYETLFLRQSAKRIREGKAVYIRKIHHDRIMKFLRVATEGQITLYSYLNNILENHFETFREDIDELYEKNNHL